MSDGGKGDKTRPLSVPKKQFDDNWDKIFKKKCPKCGNIKDSSECKEECETKEPL